MKKFKLLNILKFVIAVVLTFSLFPFSSFANTAEPFASDYIISYYASANASATGKITITSKISTLYTDSVSIDVTLQVLDNGVWKDETSWHKSSNSSSLTIENNYSKAVGGKKYRAVVNFDALVSGKVVESRTMTTTSATAY